MRDNNRFADDYATWFGKPIIELRTQRSMPTAGTWEKRRWLNGPGGALCTVEMKKNMGGIFNDREIYKFSVTQSKRSTAQKFDRKQP